MKEQTIPTRMELMKIKQRINLAVKGHGLLKKKRDALIIELFKVLKRARDMRKELNILLKNIYPLLYTAIAETSEHELIAYASGIKLDYEIKSETKNVMGVKLLLFNFEIKNIERPRHIHPLIEECSSSYTKILEYLVKTAEIENVVKKLLKEIEKTKRRVNALEYIMIPSLEKEKKDIMQKLEELERDSFTSLKKIKEMLESQS